MILPPGLILAAPSSGSGKTVVTLALLRALRARGVRVTSAKAGPDYIDPTFHTAATGRSAANLDGWAMRPETLARYIAATADSAELVLVEGVMGLFDGANLPGRPDAGSTADLAGLTGWPVVLIIDAAKQAASVAALVSGFARHRDDVNVAGVIFNRVGSQSHAQVLDDALASACPTITRLGTVPRDARLDLPERHLGLVQAGEHRALENFIDGAADMLREHIDLDALTALARAPAHIADSVDPGCAVAPLGQRIAVARDEAFAFIYDSLLSDWRAAGRELSLFSPLADEAPAPDSDAVYLPGGYPELHGARLANADRFRAGLRHAAARGAAIFGECGGYMVLGRSLTDAVGARHEMTGLLPLETSFAEQRLHLGYREVSTCTHSPLGQAGTTFRGHEFHYATVTAEDNASPLFTARNARGDELGPAGISLGRVAGSFIHLIDSRATEEPTT